MFHHGFRANTRVLRYVPAVFALSAFAMVFTGVSCRQAQAAEAATARSSSVDARYRITWLGAHIGDLRFRSNVANSAYELQAIADISVFFGTVTWKGTTTSSGVMTANGPAPSRYSFRYRTGEKGEKVDMRFAQRDVREVEISPPQKSSSKRVPVTAAHLRNVVDPLSALILMSQTSAPKSGAQACNQRLPIFDGKLRYDLVLSYKGRQAIGDNGKLRGTAYVCSVRYVPVAGHKAGQREDKDYVTGNSGMEIWLVPVPEAGLLVPYYVTIPTPAGTATMIASHFEVEGPGRS